MKSTGARRGLIAAMHRFRRLNLNVVAGGLTRGEFFALTKVREHLSEHPGAKGICVGELADEIHVTSPAVSRMLRGLEGRGLIEREVDRENRRTTYIVLTELGKRAQAAYAGRIEALADRVAERMGEENINALISLLDRLTDILSEELAKETKPC